MQRKNSMILKRIVKKKEQVDIQNMLIVGLGNPGEEYQKSRHNIGFMVVDKFNNNLNSNYKKTKYNSIISESKRNCKKIITVKPLTYMNRSGYAVGDVIRYYKIEMANFIVIYDDLDLSFGTIRLRASGGSGGHKGLQSIIDQLKTQEFARMRIGIGRPSGDIDPAKYVLKRFSKEEIGHVEGVISKASEAIFEFIDFGIESTMTKFNGMALYE